MRENALLDPDLAAIFEAWPDLPESVKDAVLKMVMASRLHQSDSYVAGPTRIEYHFPELVSLSSPLHEEQG